MYIDHLESEEVIYVSHNNERAHELTYLQSVAIMCNSY